MNLSAHHTKFFADELTKRSGSYNVDKLASVLRYVSNTIKT